MPNWITTILLAALLTLLTYKLAARSLITWRKENDARRPDQADATQPLLQGEQRENSHQEILNRAFQAEPGEFESHTDARCVPLYSVFSA